MSSDPQGSAARSYCAWWGEKPDDNDIILIQIRAWARMATLPSHVALRLCPAQGKWQGVGWAAFIELDLLCHHCGLPPEADGDHSCPCPNRDEECPDHVRFAA
jgi:hypothetical protein